MSHLETLREGTARRRTGAAPAPAPALPPWPEQAPSDDAPAPPRVDAAAKVSGAARYSADVRLPGLIHAGVLRSPVAHGRVVAIDVARAAAKPGVRAVLCHRSAPQIGWHGSRLFDPHVRFVGDEVAAVAADSPHAVEDALRAIEVRYEPYAHALDIEQALAAHAPAIHGSDNRAGPSRTYARGDVAQGFAAAEVVIDEIYRTQAAVHNSLEPHGCTAAWDDGALTVWESTQGVYQVRDELARQLGVAASRVRVICEYMGGGFGAKLVMWKHSLIAALLARAAGRPVQLMLDRQAENLAAGNRNPTRQHVRLGARRDGTLTAIELDAVTAIGAYAVGGESSNVAGIFQRLYRCANVRTTQSSVYTNTGPSCAFRAPGYVEGAFALESAMDALGRALQLDPFALRLANYSERDQVRGVPYSAPQGLRECYRRVRREFEEAPAPHRAGAATAAIARGVGVAAHEWGGGGHPPACVWAKLEADGALTVLTGTQDIGTGTRTALTQIAACELGVDLERVVVRLGDSAAGPFAPVSGGSATLATLGPAVRAAVADLGARLIEAVAALRGVDARDLRLANGTVEHAAGVAGPWPIAALAGELAPDLPTGSGRRGDNPAQCAVRTFGAQVAEVAVDTATGEVKVERLHAAHDCGRIINARLLDSQIMGGVIQGLGFALLEGRIVDPASGVPVNADLERYHLPTLADAPEVCRAGASAPDVNANTLGVKGIGEPPMIPVAPAIANAIFDAVGVRLRDTPIDRPRLLEALERRAAGTR